MSSATIKICDLCGKEYDSRVSHHWSDCVGKVVFSFKGHAGIQSVIENEVCTSCGLILRDSITNKINELSKPKENGNGKI